MKKNNFDTMATEWLTIQRQNVKRSTYDGCAVKVRQLKEVYADYRMTDFNYENIQSYLNMLYAQGAAKATIKKHLQTLRSVCSLAMKKEILKNNPCLLVEIPRNAVVNIRRALTDDEIKILLSDEKIYYKDFALLLYYTGMRMSEAIPLMWSDISFEKNEICLQRVVSYSHGKSYIDNYLKNKDKQRILPMSAPLVALLHSLPNTSPYVYPNADGNMMARNTARVKWERFQAGSGLTEVTPHMLRHTFATNMYRAGIDLKTLQKITGHHDLSVLFKRYIHDDITAVKQSVTLMDAFYNNYK